ncbi:uncharacterized protein [Haliotis cracherodii]|uniref:uncharacterized protein isoform X2 n=1 Tax=Haliotis cracherodii TaxID=6455 RepID=UPI0039ECD8F6
MASEETFLQQVNIELVEGWEAKLSSGGRIYYVDHKNQTSSWLPPRDNWDASTGLPYGWETGVDRNDKPYYINHIEKYTTREDPRNDPDYIEPPKPRDVELLRDPEKGFGFVAGSEKPVVVRFVTDGGPSVDKLLSGDQILRINGEDVRKAPREKVIELVRACKQAITLTVCQPYSDNSSRKSALLTAAKKAKLKSNPSRVRFADSVMVNGAPVLTPSAQESYVPFMPNVLKVFLENGQTKSFKYDNKTTVKDVMQSLQEKLNIQCIHHFNVVLQNMKNNTAGKMTLLQEHETLAEIAARPGARHFRCLFRVAYVPRDAYDLVREDAIAFEYFYLQCCNDVIHERFVPELKYDTALRLAALHIQQHATSNNMTGKISIKAIEKECGLDKFVPHSLIENMKGKDLRKMLNQYLKMNQSLTAPGQKQLTPLQAKLHYMKIVSELKTFGSRVFMVTLLDQKTEAMVLVGPKSGISVVTNIKSYTLSLLAEFDQMARVRVTKEGENMHRVDIELTDEKAEPISLGLLTEDAQNFVCMASGYYKIFVDRDKRIVETTQGKNTSDPDVPAYSSKHRVKGARWAYPEDLVSEVVDAGQVLEENGQVSEDEKLIDLGQSPPPYTENKEYLAQIKQELGMKSEDPKEMVETVQLNTFHNDDSDVTSLETPSHNTSIYEEAVTSFGATGLSVGDDSTEESSLNSSASSQQNRLTFQTFLSTASQNGTAKNVRKTGPLTNGHSAFEPSRLEEIPSDTDSGSGADLEKRPLLSSQSSLMMNGDARTSFDVESDDTDSWGTPHDSPAKGRMSQGGSEHSFGLLSPDLLPSSDQEQQQLLESFGLHSPDDIPQELIDVLNDPTTMKGQRVYFDPDIIGKGKNVYIDSEITDLTLFPPPVTPEDDNIIDFTMLALPPPTFTPKPGLTQPSTSLPLTSTAAEGSTVGQPAPLVPTTIHRVARPAPPPPVRGSPQQKLAKSASVGHCPDFFDNDIDELIARFTVPPPPSEIDSESSDPLAQTWHGARPKNPLEQATLDMKMVEDEFASLIIPPPPESSTASTDDIPVVPPVSDAKAETKRKKFRHKRSSSVDVSSLQLAKDFLATNKSKSVDSSQPGDKNADKSVHRQLEPPSSLGQIGKVSGKRTGIAAESPATVSEKLNSLLASLPRVEGASWTGSLRLHRSSSLDILASAESAMLKPGQQKAASLRVMVPKRASSVDRTPLSQLFNPPEERQKPVILMAQSFDSVKKPSKKDSEGSEHFASLKAKLKACKDDLVQKSNRSSFRLKKNKSESSENVSKEKVEEGKSSLRRSGSFSDLVARFSKRGSKENIKKSMSQDGSGDTDSNLDGCLTPVSDSKKSMKMIETLALPRSTILRPPITTNSSEKSKSKKGGPLKALSSIFGSEEKTEKGGTLLRGGHSAKSKTDQSKSKKFQSKDDSNMLSRKSREKIKANPYATVKMWRPLSMTTSSIKDDDVYQSFDDFREMASQLKQLDKTDSLAKEPVKLKKTISFEDETKPDYSDTTSRDTEFSKLNGSVKSDISVPKKDPPPILRRSSVSEESYSLVSGSVTDSVKYVVSHSYGVEDFDTATNDVERLLTDLKSTMESLKASRIDRSPKQFEMCREELISQTRHFVNDAKLLVSSATHTKEKLAVNLDKGIHTLAKLFLHSQAVMLMMQSVHQAQHLGFEVIKVSNSFKSTLNAANAACGKPLTDPHMKYLMRQATNLASLLSTLLKTLKELKNESFSLRL